MAFTYKKSIFAPEQFTKLPKIKGMEIYTGCTHIRYKERDDLLCVKFSEEAVTASVFTKSSMPSAPVDWCQKNLQSKSPTSILIVNAGNANAFTGQAGALCCQEVADALSRHFKCPTHQIFQSSTGVIGAYLDGKILAHTAIHATKLSDFHAAAQAIMTTDTFAKGSGHNISIQGKTASISGIAKGSGMIAPNMGTMLAFIFTDVQIKQELLQSIVKEVTDQSFNMITVDGDTSTSDTFAVFATGASDVHIENAEDIAKFKQSLQNVATDLALQIVKDGEGLTKFVRIHVDKAHDYNAARNIGLSIANSPLVKTAIAGEDPNWGRIIAAIGKSGEKANRDLTAIKIGDYMIAQNGQIVANYQEAPVAKYMKQKEIDIYVSVGIHNGKATVYTSDLTHDYISINADYRS